MYKRLSRAGAAVLVLLILSACLPALAVRSSSTSLHLFSVEFFGVDKEVHTYTAEYADEYFLGDPAVYEQGLARTSLCCAVASFRFTADPQAADDINLRRYLDGAGFDDIETDSYDTAPTATSIGNGIAHRTLPDGRELVALVTCSGGYGKEWLSNLNVGNKVRHVGFEQASKLSQDRLADYLERHAIGSDAVLWVTGFSRGGAVSNVTAADMTDSGRFAKVFAYTFATPRTTREPGSYDNIFNIMGSQDIVPEVPLSDWGYVRYGIDRFIASQENYSDYPAFTAAADAVSLEIGGRHWRNNPVVNYELKQVLRYLLTILETPEEYEQYLYPELCALWDSFGSDQMLPLLKEAVSKMQGLPAEKQRRVQEFLDFLSPLIYKYSAGGNTAQIENGLWDTSTTLTDNLMHEHSPLTYLSAVLSSEDGEGLFAQEPSFVRFVLSGDRFDIDLSDIYGYILSFDQNAKLRNEPYSALAGERDSDTLPLPFIYKQGSQVIVELPLDRLYILTLSSPEETELSYLGTTYTPTSLMGRTSDIIQLTMQPDDLYFIVTGKQDELAEDILWGDRSPVTDDFIGDETSVSESWDRDLPYSPSMLLALESTNFFQMDLMKLVRILFFAVALSLALLVTCLILAFIRMLRKKQARPGGVIAFHVVFLLMCFLLEEGARFYMRGFPFVMSILKGLASLNIALLALKGRRRIERLSDNYICLSLLIFGAGDVLMNIRMPLAVGIDALGTAVLAYGYAREKKPVLWQWILAGVLCMLFGIPVFMLRARSPIFFGLFLCYAAAFALMFALSLRIRPQTVISTVILIVSNGILAYNLIMGETVSHHLISLGVYYFAMFMLACSVWFEQEVPYKEARRLEKEKKGRSWTKDPNGE